MSVRGIALIITGILSCTVQERMSPEQITHDHMADLAGAVLIYEQRHGTLPENLDELSVIEPPYFEPSQRVDAWGGKIAYTRSPADAQLPFRFCSPGPNGVAEAPGGDDLCYSPWEGLVKGE